MSIERKMIVRGAVATGIPLSIALALFASQDQQVDSPWPDHNKYPGSPTPVPAQKIVPSLTPSPADLLAYDGRGNPSPTVTAGLRVSPTPSVIPSPETVYSRGNPSPTASSGRHIPSEAEVRAWGINPADPNNFVNQGIAQCVNKSGTSGPLALLLDLFVQKAEAAVLQKIDPAEAQKGLECIRAVDQETGLFSKRTDLKDWQLDAGKLTVDDFIAKDSIAGLRKTLVAVARQHGFIISQQQVDLVLGQQIHTIFKDAKDRGKIKEFWKNISDDQQKMWVIADKGSGNLILVFHDCTNAVIPVIPVQEITPTASPVPPKTATPKPPEAPPTATSTPKPEQPTQPPATATSQPPTASATPKKETATPAPTQPPVATATEKPTPESTATLTPKPTVIPPTASPAPTQPPVATATPKQTVIPVTATPIKPG